MRLLLLGGEAVPVPALPLPVAIVLALVTVALPTPEFDLLLFGVARGAVTGVWLLLALDNQALEVLGCGERYIKVLGRSDLLVGLAGVGFLAGSVMRGAVLYGCLARDARPRGEEQYQG